MGIVVYSMPLEDFNSINGSLDVMLQGRANYEPNPVLFSGWGGIIVFIINICPGLSWMSKT